MNNFVCDNCGTVFNEKQRFCPTCWLDDDVELKAYCEVCKRVTRHEDGVNIKTGVMSIWCIEHKDDEGRYKSTESSKF
jgi:RNA polymerase subunit RPABC4/transcription elongation factor Spt4